MNEFQFEKLIREAAHKEKTNIPEDFNIRDLGGSVDEMSQIEKVLGKWRTQLPTKYRERADQIGTETERKAGITLPQVVNYSYVS